MYGASFWRSRRAPERCTIHAFSWLLLLGSVEGDSERRTECDDATACPEVADEVLWALRRRRLRQLAPLEVHVEGDVAGELAHELAERRARAERERVAIAIDVRRDARLRVYRALRDLVAAAHEDVGPADTHGAQLETE